MAAPPIWLWALGGAGTGLLAGSFIATIVVRWPAGRSVAAGRSRCDSCDAVLPARDLVPILSYAIRRGRCRLCAGRIDPRHLYLEIAAAAIGAASFAALAGPAGIVAALSGWLLLALGLIAGACGIDPPLADRLIGAAAGYAALSLIGFAYAALRGRAGIGGGDAKLLAAIGAWLGWRPLPVVVLAAALGGLALVGARLIRGRRVTAQDRLPLGTLLAGAAWLLWLAGPIAPPG